MHMCLETSIGSPFARGAMRFPLRAVPLRENVLYELRHSYPYLHQRRLVEQDGCNEWAQCDVCQFVIGVIMGMNITAHSRLLLLIIIIIITIIIIIDNNDNNNNNSNNNSDNSNNNNNNDTILVNERESLREILRGFTLCSRTVRVSTEANELWYSYPYPWPNKFPQTSYRTRLFYKCVIQFVLGMGMGRGMGINLTAKQTVMYHSCRLRLSLPLATRNVSFPYRLPQGSQS